MPVRLMFGIVRPAFRLLPLHYGVLYRSTELYRCAGVSKTSILPTARLVTTVQSFDLNSSKGGWWNFSTEWKIVTSVIVAVTTFFLNASIERKQLQKETTLKRIQSQIKYLYGPLYGNRLVSDSSYRAVMTNHTGLEKYLHEARLRKDADMIHRWRSYVWNVLYPLDKMAVEMILNNAHLVITEGQFPEEFEQLLIHAARMEFVMEYWKADDGTLLPTKKFTADDYLEINNGSRIDYRTPISEHVREKYRYLRQKHEEILLEISSERQTDNALNGFYKKIVKAP